VKSRNAIIGAVGIIALLFCACGITLAGLSAWFMIKDKQILLAEKSPSGYALTATKVPSFTPEILLPSSTSVINPHPFLSPSPGSNEIIENSRVASDTLEIFENTVVPMNDPIELAQQLTGKTDIPTQLETPLRQYELEDQEIFWVLNSDSNQNFQVQATLRYITDHAYFWIEVGISYDQDDLKSLMETFDHQIYPTNHTFFGSEWSPGVDADPRIFILYARKMGGSTAGYFSPVDEYLPVVYQYSNTHEMVFLNADRLRLGGDYTYSVLAHEYQHMIQWYLDRNEETWMFEGMANLAAFVNGYDVGGSDFSYAHNPDLQLNYWSTGQDNRASHYGAAFLFLAYFLDRFGDSATQDLVADQANGMTSVDSVLSRLAITDDLTGATIKADDVFSDWVIANFVQDAQVPDGRFVYSNYPDAPQTEPTEEISSCPLAPTSRDVSQYGVDYIRIDCQGSFSFSFEGTNLVKALPADPYSGDYAFYSNHGDESAMTLSHKFDFTSHSSPLTFSYWTWFDIEKDYDYLYLLASQDGYNWKILTTPSGTADDPTGNNLGWGYTGHSVGSPGSNTESKWIHETVDISQFAGQQVWLKFSYITDSAVYAEGFLVDDISISEISYFSDFENDDGGWQAEGFVRIQNILPQSFRISLILVGEDTRVEKLSLDAHNRLEIPLILSNSHEYAVLVVSGVTRFTRQKAVYQISILQN
jgi:immune inhibitor A